ncbi:MAG: aminotransferase class V-fold PLP-dependent enzyme [Acetobacterales bacterium]
MDVYGQLGVRRIINAKGPSTRVSGNIMDARVAEAMVAASRECVDMTALQARAAEVIAEVTGAESGIVTSGAAAGLLLGTAACLTGLDPSRMNRLPDTAGMADEVVMARSQRNQYDHAIRATGARLVEVGLPDRLAGPGVRDAEPWEYAAAVTDRTAAIFYLAHRASRPALEDVARVARDAGVPLIVDAASQVPPRENLRNFIATGADLVVFSGGKAIGGPQASGILCGRRDLVAAAALQMLDMDIPFEHWHPPAGFIDRNSIPGLPHHGIGRGCKAGKEEIVGLLTALRLFASDEGDARLARWRQMAAELLDALDGLPGAELALEEDGYRPGIAGVRIAFPRPATAVDMATALLAGDPAVHCDSSRDTEGVLRLSPVCMKPDDIPLLADRIRAALG